MQLVVLRGRSERNVSNSSCPVVVFELLDDLTMNRQNCVVTHHLYL